MTRFEKIQLLWGLERKGVVREEMPEPDDRGGTKYWPFKVLKPAELPDSLKAEFERLGEVRW